MNTFLFPALVTGLMLLATVGPGRAELDFTLKHKTMTNDGLPMDNPYIADGASRIFLQLPNLWKTFDGPAGIDFIPNVPDSKVRLESVKGSKPLTVDQAGARDLLAKVGSQVPEGGKAVELLPVEMNALPIFNWQTMEVTVNYELFGQKMRRSILHAQMMPGRTVELTVVAPDADFLRVHKEARHILSSWFEPTRDLPPDLLQKFDAPNLGGS